MAIELLRGNHSKLLPINELYHASQFHLILSVDKIVMQLIVDGYNKRSVLIAGDITTFVVRVSWLG